MYINQIKSYFIIMKYIKMKYNYILYFSSMPGTHLHISCIEIIYVISYLQH